MYICIHLCYVRQLVKLADCRIFVNFSHICCVAVARQKVCWRLFCFMLLALMQLLTMNE